MKVIALKQGYFGKLRAAGDEFDVPEGAKASWFEPAEPKAEGRKQKPAAADKTATGKSDEKPTGKGAEDLV